MSMLNLFGGSKKNLGSGARRHLAMVPRKLALLGGTAAAGLALSLAPQLAEAGGNLVLQGDSPSIAWSDVRLYRSSPDTLSVNGRLRVGALIIGTDGTGVCESRVNWRPHCRLTPWSV